MASYISANRPRFISSLSGPAIEVFKRKLGKFQNVSLDDLMRRCDWALTGTGWQSDNEWLAISLARAEGKRVVSILDNWVNYSARFVRNNIEVLPDQIWVVDEFAYGLATRAFPNTPIVKIELPNLRRDFKNRVLEFERIYSTPQKGTVLFLSDNTLGVTDVSHEPGFAVSDNDGFELTFNRRHRLDYYVAPITIRPHPSEPISNWLWAISKFGDDVEISEGRELEEDIARHGIVIGGRTIALTFAVDCRRTVFSTYLTLGRQLPIPRTGIQPLP